MHPMRAIESYGPAELAHGPMFVGFFFNVLLYGVMIIQTYLYFTVFRSDRTWTKTFIACIFLLDTLNTVFDFTYLYDSLITHFADVPFLARANWLFATDPIMTAIIASLVQMFFAWRVKTLTGNIWLAILVSTCALVGLAGGLATSVNVILTPVFKDFIHFKSAVIVWLAAECVGDILITIILVYHLVCLGPVLVKMFLTVLGEKSNKTGLEGSDILLDRIIRLTMQTGLATSLCATIDLILFLSDPIGLHLIFNFPLSKLYTNSLLCSLNARTPQGAGSADSGRTGLMVSKRSSIAPPPQFRSHVVIDVESIRVSDVSAV